VSRYQKGKTNLDFTEARDSEWQWHQLGHMQVCTSLQTNNHASTPPHSFLQAGCPSCRTTNSVKALKEGHHAEQKSLNHTTNAVHKTNWVETRCRGFLPIQKDYTTTNWSQNTSARHVQIMPPGAHRMGASDKKINKTNAHEFYLTSLFTGGITR